jgi:hypothetical protein
MSDPRIKKLTTEELNQIPAEITRLVHEFDPADIASREHFREVVLKPLCESFLCVARQQARKSGIGPSGADDVAQDVVTKIFDPNSSRSKKACTNAKNAVLQQASRPPTRHDIVRYLYQTIKEVCSECVGKYRKDDSVRLEEQHHEAQEVQSDERVTHEELNFDEKVGGEDQLLLRLRLIEGLSFTDIAELLSTPGLESPELRSEHAVRRRYNQLLESLRPKSADERRV